MTTKKKIILTILLAVLVGVGVYLVVVNIQGIVGNIEVINYYKSDTSIVAGTIKNNCIYNIIVECLCIFVLLSMIVSYIFFIIKYCRDGIKYFALKTIYYPFQDYKIQKLEKLKDKVNKIEQKTK